MNDEPRRAGHPDPKPGYIAHDPGHDAAVENPEIQHEPRDVNVRFIAMFAAFTAAVLLVAGIGSWFLFGAIERRQAQAELPLPPVVDTEQEPPEPRLEAEPQAHWQTVREAELQRLNTSDWVDQANGTVRIPIDRAMELLIEQGLPAREEVPDPEMGAAEEAHELDPSGGHELDASEATPEPEDSEH